MMSDVGMEKSLCRLSEQKKGGNVLKFKSLKGSERWQGGKRANIGMILTSSISTSKCLGFQSHSIESWKFVRISLSIIHELDSSGIQMMKKPQK